MTTNVAPNPFTRRLVLVGAIKNRVVEFAYRCAWCSCWFSAEDAVKAAQGALTSHGICEPCAAAFDAPPPAA